MEIITPTLERVCGRIESDYKQPKAPPKAEMANPKDKCHRH